MKDEGGPRRARARAVAEPRLRSDAANRRRRSNIRLALAAGLAFAAALAVAVPLAGAAKDETILVSRSSQGMAADRPSRISSVSADGRYVAFASVATNLSDADADEFMDIFVRDTLNNKVTLVSRPSNPREPANGDSFDPEISDDGRFVAFESQADNLSEADHDSLTNVFVHDLAEGTTTLVSRGSATDADAGDAAVDHSQDPTISGDGRYVAFTSAAVNLDHDASLEPDTTNVYVRDLTEKTTELVSRVNESSRPVGGDLSSASPSISADGRRVAFQSNATNLTRDELMAETNVFVRDLVFDETTLVSRESRRSDGSAPAGGGDSALPSISGDGSRVAFASRANNFRQERHPRFDAFVHDLETHTTTLVSRPSGSDGEESDLPSDVPFQPSISSNGRYVAFESRARNLSADDPSPDRDIYVRDLATEITLLASRASGPEGESANDEAFEPSISPEGRFVTFTSLASNLDESAGALTQIYRRDILGEPSGGLLAGAAQFGPSLGVQRIEAHSDANAENARGHFGVSQPGEDELLANVTCLVVSGNRAVAGGVIESEGASRPHGSGFLLFVEDNGSPGRSDRAETVWSDAPPAACPPPREPVYELDQGNFVVK